MLSEGRLNVRSKMSVWNRLNVKSWLNAATWVNTRCATICARCLTVSIVTREHFVYTFH